MKKLFAFTLLISLTLTAAAQRTAKGERMAYAQLNWTVSSVGIGAGMGQYTVYGYWFGELAFNNRLELDAISSEKIYYPRLNAAGGYMYRLLNDHRRTINFYGGGDAFLGLEFLDLYRTLSTPVRESLLVNGYKESPLIYGFSPRAELEWFAFPYVAVILNVRIPIAFGSKFPVLGMEIGLGARYNF